mgnify:CR=1 FL=1
MGGSAMQSCRLISYLPSGSWLPLGNGTLYLLCDDRHALEHLVRANETAQPSNILILGEVCTWSELYRYSLQKKSTSAFVHALFMLAAHSE